MLYVEDKPLETLAVSSGVPIRKIQLAKDKGRVCKLLSKSKNVFGMVDEDPLSAQSTYLRQLPNVEKNHDIKLLRDSTRNNHLIIICPESERWIIATTKTSKLELKSYNLSEIPRNLHSEINQRLNNLQSLINDLIGEQNRRMLYLQSLLKPLTC